MPNPARYMDDAAEGIRRLLTKGGVVLPPPGAARAAGNAADVVIDPAIAARAARQMEPDFSGVRVTTPEAVPFPDYLDDFDNAVRANGPDMSLGSSLWDQMDKGARAYDNTLKGRTANLRNQPFAKAAQDSIRTANERSAKMRAGMEASAARGEMMADAGVIGAGVGGATALGAGAYALTRPGASPEPKATAAPAPTPPVAAPSKPKVDPLFDEKTPLTSTGGTAELANESRPAPPVAATTDPRTQAQDLIAQLNQMRRAAGGEVPEAKQMMAEINRLLALSNQSRNAMTPQQAAGSSDPHTQAQALIAQLNDMRRKAGGEVPQAQQIMAEVRRLQSLGDQRRNAAQTR